LKEISLVKLLALGLALIALCSPAIAQETTEATPAEQGKTAEQSGKYVDIKIPEGFKPEPVEEPGIFKWKKDSGEIYVVVGDLFTKSGDHLFKSLKEAAEKDGRFQSVQVQNVKGGRALLIKEKTPSDSGRLMSWRLIVVTSKKILNVDFTAPAKDFKSFQADFDKASKSFKLKTQN